MANAALVPELLRELWERAEFGETEWPEEVGTGDDALVMDWLGCDGNFYRVTLERIEP